MGCICTISETAWQKWYNGRDDLLCPTLATALIQLALDVAGLKCRYFTIPWYFNLLGSCISASQAQRDNAAVRVAEGWVLNGFGWEFFLSFPYRCRKGGHGGLGCPAAAPWLGGFLFKVIPNLPLLKYGTSATLFYILSLASIFFFYVHLYGRWILAVLWTWTYAPILLWLTVVLYLHIILSL